MSCTIDKTAYESLIKGDLDWLMKQPRSLERDHIEALLKQSPELIYDRCEWEKRKEAEYTEQMRQLNEEWKVTLEVQRTMLVDAIAKWLENRVSFGVHPCSGMGVVMEFKQTFEDKKKDGTD